MGGALSGGQECPEEGTPGWGARVPLLEPVLQGRWLDLFLGHKGGIWGPLCRSCPRGPRVGAEPAADVTEVCGGAGDGGAGLCLCLMAAREVPAAVSMGDPGLVPELCVHLIGETLSKFKLWVMFQPCPSVGASGLRVWLVFVTRCGLEGAAGRGCCLHTGPGACHGGGWSWCLSGRPVSCRAVGGWRGLSGCL